MIDYQRIAADVFNALCATGPGAEALLRESAADYSAVVDEINSRLLRCHELLTKGLRSEAIQQCDSDPNLLDVVALLDTPELSAWRDRVVAQGLAAPSALRIDIAATLNEAYAVEQPLQTLLRRHRALALARASLRDRIATLRHLAKLDGDNPNWQDDLRVYEKARIEQIPAEVDEAARGDAVDTLGVLVAELEDDSWLERPRTVVVQRAVHSAREVVKRLARAELARLEPELNRAYSELDHEGARALRARWESTADTADLMPGDPPSERAAPALEWIDAEDRRLKAETDYQAALAALETALDEDRSLSEYERLAHAVVRHGHGITPLLEQRCRMRIESLEARAARRRRLLLGAVIAAVLFTAVSIVWTIRDRQRRVDVAARSALVEGLIKDDKLSEAQAYLQKLRTEAPHVARSPQIERAAMRLADLQKKEAERRRTFRAAIAKAEKAGAETPDQEALHAARRTGKAAEERAQLAELEDAIADVERQRQKQRDKAFAAELIKLGDDVDAFAQADTSDLQASIEAGERLRTRVTALRKAPRVSSDVMAQLNPTDTRLTVLQDQVRARQRQIELFADITENVGTPSTYRAVLSRYVQEFPNDSRSTDFKLVLEHELVWLDGLAAWNDFNTKWTHADVGRLSSAAARKLAVEAQSLLRDLGEYPAAEELKARLPYLEAIGRRKGEDGAKLHNELETLLSDKSIANLWLIQLDGIRYYLTQEAKLDSEPVTVRYLTSFEGAENQKVVAKNAFQGTNPRATQDQAAHSRAAQKALLSLANMDFANWERTFLEIMKYVRTAEPVEPVVKLLLLQRVLTTAAQGSNAIATEFQRHREQLDAPNLDLSVNWLDPDDKEAKAANSAAEQLLDRLPDWQAAAKTVLDDLDRLNRPLAGRHVWIGWLARTSEGQWLVMTSDAPKSQGDLFVACQPDGGPNIQLRKIGRLSEKGINLGDPRTETFVQGRPVFVLNAETVTEP